MDCDHYKDVERARSQPAEFWTVEADRAQHAVDDTQGRVEQEVEQDSNDHQREHKGNEEDTAKPFGESRVRLQDDGEEQGDPDLEEEAADHEQEAVAQRAPEELVTGHLNEVCQTGESERGKADPSPVGKPDHHRAEQRQDEEKGIEEEGGRYEDQRKASIIAALARALV